MWLRNLSWVESFAQPCCNSLPFCMLRKTQQPHIVSSSLKAPVEGGNAHQALWPGTHMGKIIIIMEGR